MAETRRLPGSHRFRETLKRVPPVVALNTCRHIALNRARSLRRRASDRLVITRYLETHPVRKLQIGSGPNLLAGWLNTDRDIDPQYGDKIVFLDATEPFPFSDTSFDYIFSEHQIEHISERDARTMLRECFRVLRPSGRMRIATPDLAAIVGLYQDPLTELERHYVDWVTAMLKPNALNGNPRCHVINQMFNAYGHQFIYDYETLSQALINTGFVEVRRWGPGESDDPLLCDIESHGRALGDEDVNRFETMVLEGTCPPLHPR